MRVAVCLAGMLGQESGKWGRGKHEVTKGAAADGLTAKPFNTIDPELGYRQYDHHLFSKNENVDTFLHIRDLDYEEQLLDLYKPKKYLSEEYKDFDTDEFCKGDQNIEHQRACSKAQWSRFYSFYKAVEQKRKYEEENNFKYDCVFIARYDLLAFEDFIFSDYDMSYFYAPFSMWQMRVSGHTVATSINDLWFFSSSDQIDEFSSLFLDIGKYAKDSHNNPVSPHLTTSNKLRESNSKLKFVLNCDVNDNCDVSHTATLRMREAKYWSYDEETKLYKLKQEYKERLNKSEHEIDWSKNFQSHWPLYKGMTGDEFKEYLVTTGWDYSDGTPV